VIAGLILSETLEESCSIAFLGENLETFDATTNEEIVELIKDKEPEILAVDVGTEQAGKEFTKQEADLKEEGFIFTPNSYQKKKVERLQSLKKHVNHELGGQIEFIRFEPQITAEELAIDGDEDLASFGVEGDIGSVEEFDAVLGAVTAQFYSEGHFEDYGVIIPEKI
jgi:predicted nuclease with RNAse H fold